ncbi:DUF1848 domain-containing protein [Caldisalinibacter kiritimatiensis]|uniref:DUF1848 domain-containing protein n=1 Tax=Caldisalinibacter kiritimatiensis TaxID=1304284 RepID=R1AWY1_9FIRM|nr:DUF1848 domain-containing protein [Caldisalinibacter kiritimatiensis]EOD01162.1 hypothetical protein L21TH_0767 [Caldisalinibacter kiritimatiensis]
MIISVSRRTDIPAFYSDWFFNRLKEGYVYVRNPFNRKQVSKINLNPEVVDCFVFWTKDPLPMMKRLDELKDYCYYFQFTLTPYRRDIETNIRKKRDIIKTFKQLSNIIGKEKVIWRYDPIFINEFYNKEYHYEWFERFAYELSNYTEKCVISFIDLYKKTLRNTKHLNIEELKDEDIFQIAEKFSSVAQKYNIKIETCSESIDLTQYGIKKGKCINDKLISRILGCQLDVKKDNTQREVCGCVKSIDIGEYNTCKHNCLYCYANFNYKQVDEKYKKHLRNSPLLVGELYGDEKITVREMKSIKCDNNGHMEQLKLDI